MGKPRKKKIAQMEVSSFNFYLLKGEALVYPRGTITPKASPYFVQATTTDLTPDVLKEWFLQSITPLVGTDAADDLRQLFDEDTTRGAETLSSFFENAIEFRQSLE